MGQENLLLYFFFYQIFSRTFFELVCLLPCLLWQTKFRPLQQRTPSCLCLEWWCGWSDLIVTYVCACASVVVCNPSKIVEVFRSRVRKRIHPARLCFRFWYLQATLDIRLSRFWCLWFRSSPSGSSFRLQTFVWRCIRQCIWG